MPAPDSPVLLVARFLKSNGYDKTLAEFLQETNLLASSVDPKDHTTAFTLEKLLDEKRLYDLSLTLEKVDLLDHEDVFTTPYPTIPRLIAPPGAPQSNVLSVTLAPTLSPYPHPVIIATTADRALRLYTLSGALLASYPALHPSPILAVAVLKNRWLVTTSMTGHICISAADSPTPLCTAHPHTKYATKALLHSNDNILVTSSYDGSIVAHTVIFDADGAPTLLTELGRITLPTAPEALCAVTLPSLGGSGEAAIVFSRRDNTHLYYHRLAPGLPHHATHNLAPEATSWVSFHAMSLATHPGDPALLAVATSHVPAMKFMLVRVDSGDVLKEVFVGAPQGAYSTGVVAWRPAGTGVWVNSDDGLVRGVEVRSGRVVAALRVCERGEKVRTLWAGDVYVQEEGGEEGRREEVLVTGGFDKGLKVWRVRKFGEEVVEGAEVDMEELNG